MPHIATKINCDGDKCGECEKLHIHSRPDLDNIMIGGPPIPRIQEKYCMEFFKWISGDNRLNECLAAELDRSCNTCLYKDNLSNIKSCRGCGLPCLKNWQPATKGER